MSGDIDDTERLRRDHVGAHRVSADTIRHLEALAERYRCESDYWKTRLRNALREVADCDDIGIRERAKTALREIDAFVPVSTE